MDLTFVEPPILQLRDMQDIPRWKKEVMPRKNALLTNKKETYFDEDDRESVLDPHNDGLVITIYVANHFV